MIEKVLNQLQKVKRTGADRYIACCPVHNDKNPSLSVAEKDGKILLNCFGCGAGAHELVDAMGLTLNDLFSGPTDYYSSNILKKVVPASDALECIKTEALIVYIAAMRMARGEENIDLERLGTAAKLIQAVYEDYP